MNWCFYILLIMLLAIGGCDQSLEHGNKCIAVKTGSNINEKFALQIDFVEVYSVPLFEQLKVMDAKMFAAQKDNLMMSHESDMTVWSHGFVENQTRTLAFPNRSGFAGIVVFLHFNDATIDKFVFPHAVDSIELQIVDGTFKVRVVKNAGANTSSHHHNSTRNIRHDHMQTRKDSANEA